MKRVCFLVLVLLSSAAPAAEIRVLSGGAVKAPLTDLVPAFERQSGHQVKLDFLPMGPLSEKLAAGGALDMVVVTEDVLPRLQREGRLPPGEARVLGRVGIGVAVNEKAPSPDISTMEAFRKTLLAARSVITVDPKTGTSGKHLAEVFARLKIDDQLRPKLSYLPGGYVVEPVGRGEIELGLHVVSEILPVKGVRLVGLLPTELQKWTAYVAVPAPATREGAAVQSLIDYLSTPASRTRFAQSGFQ